MKGGFTMKKYIMLAIFLCAFIFNIPANAEAKFKDVPPKASYAPAVTWAIQKKIIAAFPDNTFRPKNPVTEEQFISMYTSYFKFPLLKKIAGESPTNHYYRTLEQYDIQLLGSFNTNMRTKPIIIGSATDLLAYTLQGSTRNMPEAVTYFLNNKITNNKYPSRTDLLQKFGANDLLTRADAVTLLYNLDRQKLRSVHPNVLAKNKSKLPQNTLTKQYKEIFPLIENLHVGVKNADFKKLELELFIQQEVVAGFISAEETAIGNYTIGQFYTEIDGEPFTTTLNNKKYTYYFDQLNNNKLISVFWTNSNFDINKYFYRVYTASETIQLSKLAALLTNEFRVKNNLKAIVSYDPIVQVAYLHSKNMAENNYFEHVNPLTKEDIFKRVQKAGLNYQAVSGQGLVGENIAYIETENGVFDAHNMWINSPLHRQHMLYKSYLAMGLGVYNALYTVNFINPKY